MDGTLCKYIKNINSQCEAQIKLMDKEDSCFEASKTPSRIKELNIYHRHKKSLIIWRRVLTIKHTVKSEMAESEETGKPNNLYIWYIIHCKIACLRRFFTLRHFAFDDELHGLLPAPYSHAFILSVVMLFALN